MAEAVAAAVVEAARVAVEVDREEAEADVKAAAVVVGGKAEVEDSVKEADSDNKAVDSDKEEDNAKVVDNVKAVAVHKVEMANAVVVEKYEARKGVSVVQQVTAREVVNFKMAKEVADIVATKALVETEALKV
jgi:hypothetical protein